MSREASIELVCVGTCDDDDKPTWVADGRFNADGEFEPESTGDLDCPECGERGEPTVYDVRIADV